MTKERFLYVCSEKHYVCKRDVQLILFILLKTGEKITKRGLLKELKIRCLNLGWSLLWDSEVELEELFIDSSLEEEPLKVKAFELCEKYFPNLREEKEK